MEHQTDTVLVDSSIAERAWFGDMTARSLYFGIAVLASREGTMETSLPDLSRRLGMTEKQIRNALDKLSADGSVTSEKRHRGRLLRLSGRTFGSYSEFTQGQAEGQAENMTQVTKHEPFGDNSYFCKGRQEGRQSVRQDGKPYSEFTQGQAEGQAENMTQVTKHEPFGDNSYFCKGRQEGRHKEEKERKEAKESKETEISSPFMSIIPPQNGEREKREKRDVEMKEDIGDLNDVRPVFVPAGRIEPPTTVAEVMQVAVLQGCPLTRREAQDFLDYNAARGWMIGSTYINDWRRLVRSWADRQRTRFQRGQQRPVLDRTHYSVNL